MMFKFMNCSFIWFDNYLAARASTYFPPKQDGGSTLFLLWARSTLYKPHKFRLAVDGRIKAFRELV